MELSDAEQNYLKHIFEIEVESSAKPTTNMIAEVIGKKPPSVSEMLKKLSKKGLVNYKPYQAISLTKKGRLEATKTLRRRRLWETFLVNELDCDWQEGYEIAPEFEKIQDEQILKKIDLKLNFPKLSPFGKIIPNNKGFLQDDPKLRLSQLKPGDKAQVIGIDWVDQDFLNALKEAGISPMGMIKVKDKDIFENHIRIIVEKTEHQIREQYANHVLVKKTSGILRIF